MGLSTIIPNFIIKFRKRVKGRYYIILYAQSLFQAFERMPSVGLPEVFFSFFFPLSKDYFGVLPFPRGSEAKGYCFRTDAVKTVMPFQEKL